jgi:DnaJ-class molecular chaperone
MNNPAPDDLYGVLGLAPDASPEQITRAYRARLREHHPDTRERNEHDSDPREQLQQVLNAYAVLRDPARRNAYERRRTAHARAPASRATRWAFGPAQTPVSPIRAGPVRWYQ